MASPEAIRDAVFGAASENSELLNTLAKTSEAPSIYSAHLVHFDKLETSLTEQQNVLDSLKTQTELRFKSHKKLRNSVTKKWFYRATKMLPKFEAKAMTEEREYFTALGAQSKAEERCKTLESEVKKAEAEKEKLLKVVKKHGDAHAKIDLLYEKLFKGPTPGFGDEDEREHKYYTSDESNESVKEGIRRARRAKSGLGVVKTYLGRAKSNMKYALTSVEERLFFFDESTYWTERGDAALALALDKMGKTDEDLLPLPSDLVGKHQVVSSSLLAARIPMGRSHSRESMIQAIIKSLEQISEVEEQLGILIAHTKEVEKVGLAKIKETARQLEDSRQELQQVRQGIFERVAGFGEAAPAYMECCDRADRFCNVPEVGHEHVQPEEEAAPPVPQPESAPPEYGEQPVTVAIPSRYELADALRAENKTAGPGDHAYITHDIERPGRTV
ncbi:uncharacterized protein LY89DRAFT_656820 [Mollisia scopiformis]|uniref:Uncharacterized protein n=1 Tax=Mollisia scopiformis TaxID=149040 RepID=A0A132BCL9_MOLSC|nr:uncharacterized protein LY89DRAFT_656820 [Mollisia scopiformis]KUJ10165.1 hypothetical protein LY89DRAFT_656820 [Mollisia scopiformis]